MSDSMTTSLSAFIDGEATAEESADVVEQLTKDESLQTEWRNYHALASVLRRENLAGIPTPQDWDALAAELPTTGDILPIRPKTRIQSMLMHGGIGAGLAACIMLATFFLLSTPSSDTDPTLALNTSPESSSFQTTPIDELPLEQPSFEESFSVSISAISPDIRDEMRRITLEALHAHDISRSGIERSLIPAASAVSRQVSREL